MVISLPFLKKKVSLEIDLDRHPVMEMIAGWGAPMKKKIEEACFANYKEKINAIGMNRSLPRLRKPSEVWKHLKVQSVRIDARVDDAAVLYLIPDWDIDLQLEICIENDQIVYCGQVLVYTVDSYAGR